MCVACRTTRVHLSGADCSLSSKQGDVVWFGVGARWRRSQAVPWLLWRDAYRRMVGLPCDGVVAHELVQWRLVVTPCWCRPSNHLRSKSVGMCRVPVHAPHIDMHERAYGTPPELQPSVNHNHADGHARGTHKLTLACWLPVEISALGWSCRPSARALS